MLHIDLFSGYGGFAYAFREVFGDEGRTILFCDNDKYCQAVLRKHWPEVPIWGDIRELIAHAYRCKQNKITRNNEKMCSLQKGERQSEHSSSLFGGSNKRLTILTGGFPCQPFSHAGKRRGKDDNRFLWPEMLDAIKIFKPRWVIAENVAGLTNMVKFESELEVDEKEYTFEEVSSGQISVGEVRGRRGKGILEEMLEDLEKEGYTVWPFIIPACAVNAPHRRDRVWIVGHCTDSSSIGCDSGCCDREKRHIQGTEIGEIEKDKSEGDRWINRVGKADTDVAKPKCGGLERRGKQTHRNQSFDRESWERNWKEVAAATCIRGVDDGTPLWMDGVRVSKAKHRIERLRMGGNGIVPEVAMEIMRAIRDVTYGNDPYPFQQARGQGR